MTIDDDYVYPQVPATLSYDFRRPASPRLTGALAHQHIVCECTTMATRDGDGEEQRSRKLSAAHSGLSLSDMGGHQSGNTPCVSCPVVELAGFEPATS